MARLDQHVRPGVGCPMEQHPELARVEHEHEHAQRRDRSDGRIARTVLEECLLADEAAPPEGRHPAAVDIDGHLSLDDHEEFSSRNARCPVSRAGRAALGTGLQVTGDLLGLDNAFVASEFDAG